MREKIGTKILNCPYDGKQFFFPHRVFGFRKRESTRNKGNRTITLRMFLHEYGA